MTHKMRLKQKPFSNIVNEEKVIEMRLNDEKRQKIRIGDRIKFTTFTDSEYELDVIVTNITEFDNFEDLYSRYKKQDLGYKRNERPDACDMLEYYSKEQIEKYGVLAIRISFASLIKVIEEKGERK